MGPDGLRSGSEAFAAVYERNIRRVYQICYLYLKNHPDAEDASQAVFEKYLGRKEGFTGESHEKAWFITVSKNYCRDELKRFWKKRRVDVGETYNAACAEETDCQGSLTAALLDLPPDYKEALYLYYVEGYSVKEISALLHRNESTLRNHLAAGRRRLRIDLGGNHEA